jgi:methionine salvage enolase-phosphatase E1
MDAKHLDGYFDAWFRDKQETNSIQNVYGQTGLMAIVNFINFIKEKENVNHSHREGSQRNQKNYCRTVLDTRQSGVAS